MLHNIRVALQCGNRSQGHEGLVHGVSSPPPLPQLQIRPALMPLKMALLKMVLWYSITFGDRQG